MCMKEQSDMQRFPDPTEAARRVLLIQPHGTPPDSLHDALATVPQLIIDCCTCPATDGPSCTQLPDVALLNLGVASDAAYDHIAALHLYWPTCPIVVVSAAPSLEQLSVVFSAGARGYLRWPLPTLNLIAALQLVANGGLALCPNTAALLTHVLLPHIARQVAALALSPREVAVGERISTGQSNKTIAQELDIAVKTVEWYVARLLKKTNMRSRIELALWWSQNA